MSAGCWRYTVTTRWTIDRFEGTCAVCEVSDGTTAHIERDKLPAGCHEGDILVLKEGRYRKDKRATTQAARRIAEKMAALIADEGE